VVGDKLHVTALLNRERDPAGGP